MSPHPSAVAARLLKFACWVMPREHREWAAAMQAELPYLPRNAEFSCAAGCVAAALKQRFTPMITGNFRIHRWVFLVEMLGCFGPATLAWWFFTFGPPAGIAHWNGAMLESYLQQTTFAGHYALGLHAGHAISGLVAPIGLLLGWRYVLRNRGLDNRALGFALIAAPVLQTIAGFIGVVAFAVPALPPGVFLLLIGLPIAGIIHLMYLARPAGSAPADARLAAT